MVSYIILALYLLAISMSVASFTMIHLANRGKSNTFNRAMRRFVLIMLAMCIYDMIIYFTDYVVGPIKGGPTLRIGDCIIALLIAAWTVAADKFVNNNSYPFVNHFVRTYCYIYAAFWLVCMILVNTEELYTLRWILLVSDIGLIMMIFLGSITYIGDAVWSRQRPGKVYYLIAITALLSWNYISYFWGETSVYWGNRDFVRTPLDLTIIFWFAINLINMFVIYREAFVPSFQNKEAVIVPEFNLDDSMEAISQKYELTPRESELVRLLYEGKSNGDIAQALFISESTVKTHLYNIFRKMGVKNRIEVTCIVRGERE